MERIPYSLNSIEVVKESYGWIKPDSYTVDRVIFSLSGTTMPDLEVTTCTVWSFYVRVCKVCRSCSFFKHPENRKVKTYSLKQPFWPFRGRLKLYFSQTFTDDPVFGDVLVEGTSLFIYFSILSHTHSETTEVVQESNCPELKTEWVIFY